MKRRKLATVLGALGMLSVPLVLSMAFPGNASSPTAWEALREKVTQRCVQASALRDAHRVGMPVDFPTHMVAFVQGAWPQKHMNGAAATMLCLFDKETGEVALGEAPPQLRLDAR